MRPQPTRIQICAGAALAVLLFAPPAAAARLLQVFIDHHGEVVAHTYYDDGGRADAATVWRYLQTPPIMVDDDVTALAPAEVDALDTQLIGDLLVKFQHADRVIVRAELDQLRLVRNDPQSQAWYLPAPEVERTARIAGLGPPHVLPAGFTFSWAELTLVVAAAMALLALTAVAAFLLLRRWPTPTSR